MELGSGCPHCAAKGYVEVAMATDSESIVACKECGSSGARQPDCHAPDDMRLSYGMYCAPVREAVMRRRARWS